jgi:hypothetical protein
MCDLEFWAFGFLSGAVNRIAGWVDITGKYSVGESAVVARALGVLHRWQGLTRIFGLHRTTHSLLNLPQIFLAAK